VNVVDVARIFIGVKEATGENDGIPFELFALPGEQPLAWCARFARFCHIKAGHPLPGNPWEIASCHAMRVALTAAGGWLGRIAHPEPGDLAFFEHHVAIVAAVDGDSWLSVEGNEGNCVCQVRRRIDDKSIIGFAVWPLEAVR
jgi:hypothetical protein